MSRRPPHIGRSKVSTVSARGRGSKVRTRDEATPWREGGSFADFMAGLPGILGAAVPLTLKALKQDPAVGSGVVVTALTDIFGFATFLGLGALMMDRLL